MHAWKCVAQGYTNPRLQVTWVTKFYTVAPIIWGSSTWNLLRVTLLFPRILSWLLSFFENLWTPVVASFTCYHKIWVDVEEPLVVNSRKNTFWIMFYYFIVACRMNVEQIVQHKPLIQTVNQLRSSCRGCLWLVDNKEKVCKYHQHHLTC